MAKKKKVQRRARPIIFSYLERVNARIFDKYQKEITDKTKGHQGIYALYRKNKLYYVGLASNLRVRIKQHLKDRHQGKWTHFSLYIVRKTDHIKELESLVLRIADPSGNAHRGKLLCNKNLMPVLRKELRLKAKAEIDDLFKRQRKARKKTTRKKKTAKADKPLKGYFPMGKRLYGKYKGVDYKAWVFKSGTVKYDGTLYDSPSAAGKAARNGRETNGWYFWKYKDKNGNLVRLKELRK